MQQLLERRDVEPVGAPDRQRNVRGVISRSVGVGQATAQGVQHMAQVRPRLRFRRVRPEQERQALARHCGGGVQQQVGEQRLRARGVERRQQLAVDTQLEPAQEPDPAIGCTPNSVAGPTCHRHVSDPLTSADVINR